MRVFNDLGLPEPFIDAVRNDPYSGLNTGRFISVTSLVAPPQVTFLRRQHWEEIEEPASMRVWSLIGQTAHGILQRAAESREDCLQEQRVFHTFQDWTINGCFDLLTMPDNTLYDYKVTSIHAVQEGAKPEWVWQLSILKWIMEANGLEVGPTKVMVVMRDWSPTLAKFRVGMGYPDKPAKLFDIAAYDKAAVEAFVADRLFEIGSGMPRACTQEERWQDDEQWAVMKGTNKRATKLFDSYDEAEAFILAQKEPGKYRIEGRESIPVRCTSYCNVSRFCKQYRGNYEAGGP